MSRRIVVSLLVAVALVATPWIAYEVLEKTAERVGPNGPLLALSLTAELETRWEPATGILVVDRALHEMDETRHFWRLVGAGRRPASAMPVATLVVGR